MSVAAPKVGSDAQGLTPSARIEMFELDLTALGGSVYRFFSGINALGNNLVWQGNTYTRYPLQASGFQWNGRGTIPRPTLDVANVDGTISALVLSYQDMVGAKLTRRLTLAKYLDAVNYAQQPTVDFQFTNGTLTASAGDLVITFSRSGSTATCVAASGLIVGMAADTPRLDYGPVTRLCKGLLIEEARTNLIPWSEASDNAYWTPQYSSVSANTGVAPDGATTMDKIVENGTNNAHSIIGNDITITGSTLYTYSVFVKSAGRSFATLRHDGGHGSFGGGFCTYFDLVSGAVTQATAGITGFAEDFGSGMWKLSITGTSGVGDTLSRPVVGASNAGTGNTAGSIYTGDGTSGIFVWGHQFVAGKPTSYIPTAGASATRNPDIATITTLSPEFDLTLGTLHAEFFKATVNPTGDYDSVIQVGDGTANNRLDIGVFESSGTNKSYFAVVAGGVLVYDSPAQATTGVGVAKSVLAYAANDFVGYVNGVAVPNGTSGSVPTVTQVKLGSDASNRYLNGHLRRFTYYPQRLSNVQLALVPQPYTGDPDPTAHWPDEIFYVDRKVHEDRNAASFELASSFDVEGVRLPRRYVIQNVCPWTYRSAECSYAGGAVADANDTPTGILGNDDCGKRLASCKLRFGASAELPYGGYPSVGIVKG